LKSDRQAKAKPFPAVAAL